MSMFNLLLDLDQESRIDWLEKQVLEQQEQILKLAKMAENHGQWIEYLNKKDTKHE